MMKLCAYFGNPWIGMFAKTNNKITLVPIDSGEKFISSVADYLKTEVIKTTMGDSNLIGIYMAMNSNGAILPNIANEVEAAKIKETGLNVYISQEKQNAHGNNLVVNDKAGLVSERIGPIERKNMEDALGIELVPASIANYLTVGSACMANNRGFLAHFNASEDEMKHIQSVLKVRGNKGSVNFGAGFVSLGMLGNDLGYVAGEKTSGFELGRVEEALEYI
jgi:translation initiation factor 6